MQIGNINYNQFSKIPALSFKGDTVSDKNETNAQQAVPEAVNTQAVSVSEKDKFVKTEAKTTGVPKDEAKSNLGKTGRMLFSLVPGLGQVVNGQYVKAAGFSIGISALAISGYLLLGGLGLFPAGLLYAYNIYDAYKNA